MLTKWEIGFLGAGDVARAFPMLQIVAPELDFATWKRLTATEVLRRKWAVARDERGYIRGLVRMHTVERANAGRFLDVPIFATITLLDQDGVSRDLLNFAKAFAWEEGCDAIRFRNSVPATPEQLETDTGPPEGFGGVLYDLRTDRQWPQPYGTRPVKT
nr:GNAT family N-acetyltransferase [Rhizobium sp. Q54]